jgi:hypothetical protein
MDDLMLSQAKTMTMVEMKNTRLESWSTSWAHTAYERHIGIDIESAQLYINDDAMA